MNAQKLPKELIDVILEYAGLIKMRAGKYMRQIDMNDKKYEELMKIRPIEQSRYDTFSVFLPIQSDSNHGYTLVYTKFVGQTVQGRHFVGCILYNGKIEEYMYKLYFEIN